MTRWQTIIIGMICVFASPAAYAQNADQAIRQALQRGTAFLKEMHKPTPNYQGGSRGVGSASLAGLALLEAGVPFDDAVIQNITKYIRSAAFAQTRTYEISLAIMYLDRLDDPKDQIIIQMLGIRLMAGQTPAGGWSYHCISTVDPTIEQLLKTKLLGEVDLKNTPPVIEKGNENAPASTDGRPALNKHVVAYAQMLNTPEARGRIINMGGMDDNSNTQFGIMGTWVARKHGVPTEQALVLVEQRFRNQQDPNTGAWPYNPMSGSGTPSMTCAGLIGLAVGHGLAAEFRNSPKLKIRLPARPSLNKDPQVAAGFKYLAGVMLGGNNGPLNMPMILNNVDYYFLWSIERVGMIYNVGKMGPVDWYAYGGIQILRAQAADGSWNGSYGTDVDTCFAMLFLLRANAVKDLSASLKRGGNELRSGTGPVDLAKMDPPTGDGQQTDPKTPTPPVRRAPSLPMPTNPGTVEPSDPDGTVGSMTKQLLATSGAVFSELLGRMRDARGSEYTLALAGAAEQSTGNAQKQIRDALALRLTRMTPETLNDLLRHSSREIRRATALACAMKDDKSHISDLISALADTDPLVARAVRASLVSLTGQDFGPANDATAIQRAKAVADWRAWSKR